MAEEKKKKKKKHRKKEQTTSAHGKHDNRKHYNKKRRARRKSRKKKRSVRKKILIMILILFLLGLAAFLLWYFSFDRLNLEEYVNVSYSGYDTEGTASLSLQKTEEEIPFLNEVEVKLLSENGSLQNGDSLEIHFIYNEEAAKEQKLRIEADSCQIEVAGLPEGTLLSTEDLFHDVQIRYEGIAPELTVIVVNESTDPFLQTVSYEILEEKAFYDVGDTLWLRADFSEEEAIRNEYIVEIPEGGCQKEYTVENTDHYIRDSADVSDELIDTLNETAVSLFGDATEYGLRIFSEANLMPIWVNGKTTFRWSNPRLISAYLNVLKPEYFESASHNNDIKLVYQVTLSQADGVACSTLVVVQFSDLIQKTDGTFDLSLDSGRIIAASYRNSHIKDLVTDSYNNAYEAEKLEL